TADSICVHGDNAQAVELVKSIRQALEANGLTVKNLG
ncbi:MAG: LamB/YcsF family protein, partial [Anaerovibrio sp.]|nr:LamB/YcsF family protein [Anaerovibrio sp.]